MVESITKKVHITDEIFALIEQEPKSDRFEIDLTIGNTHYNLEFDVEIIDTREWEQDRDSGQCHCKRGSISCDIHNLMLYDIDGNEIRNTDWLIIDIEKINRNL